MARDTDIAAEIDYAETAAKARAAAELRRRATQGDMADENLDLAQESPGLATRGLVGAKLPQFQLAEIQRRVGPNVKAEERNDGRIVLHDLKTGKRYPYSPSFLDEMSLKNTAKNVADIPAKIAEKLWDAGELGGQIAGGLSGAALGAGTLASGPAALLGAALGSAAVRGVRQQVSNVISPDNLTLKQKQEDMNAAAFEGAVSEGLGRAAAPVVEALWPGNIIRRAVAGSPISEGAKYNKALGDELGIGLNIGDITQTVDAKRNLATASQLPKIQTLMAQKAVQKRVQLQDAAFATVKRYFSETGDAQAGKVASEGVDTWFNALKEERKQATKPLFATVEQLDEHAIDLAPVDAALEQVKRKFAPGEDGLRAIGRFKSRLEGLAEKASVILGPDGKPARPPQNRARPQEFQNVWEDVTDAIHGKANIISGLDQSQGRAAARIIYNGMEAALDTSIANLSNGGSQRALQAAEALKTVRSEYKRLSEPINELAQHAISSMGDDIAAGGPEKIAAKIANPGSWTNGQVSYLMRIMGKVNPEGAEYIKQNVAEKFIRGAPVEQYLDNMSRTAEGEHLLEVSAQKFKTAFSGANWERMKAVAGSDLLWLKRLEQVRDAASAISPLPGTGTGGAQTGGMVLGFRVLSSLARAKLPALPAAYFGPEALVWLTHSQKGVDWLLDYWRLGAKAQVVLRTTVSGVVRAEEGKRIQKAQQKAEKLAEDAQEMWGRLPALLQGSPVVEQGQPKQ